MAKKFNYFVLFWVGFLHDFWDYKSRKKVRRAEFFMLYMYEVEEFNFLNDFLDRVRIL